MGFLKNLLVWGVLLGAIALFGYFTSATRDDSGAVTSEGSMSVFSLRVGDCVVDDIDDGETSSTTVTPCDEVHDYEVYHDFKLPAGQFPGSDSVDEQAAGGCMTAFEETFAVPYDVSALEITYFSPTRGSWTESDDRVVTCMVFRMDEGKMVGPASGYDQLAE